MAGENPRAGGPQAAYRTDTIRPRAEIVVEADTQDQLDSVLLALSRAVSAHQESAKEHMSSR